MFHMHWPEQLLDEARATSEPARPVRGASPLGAMGGVLCEAAVGRSEQVWRVPTAYTIASLFVSLSVYVSQSCAHNYDMCIFRSRHCPDFPAAFMSADGLSLRMTSSACCTQEGYSYHSTAVRLTLGKGGADKEQRPNTAQ